MSWNYLETAQAAARAAGQVLRDWRDRFTVSEKSVKNLVTEADLAAQQTIFDLIYSRYPDHAYLGEEDLQRSGHSSPLRWIIDPLDGTSNYVHGFPYYAVSIALEDEQGLSVGVVYDPNRDEMFSAVRSQGATLDGRPIQTSGFGTLQEAMCLASLPIAPQRDDPAIERFLRVLEAAQTVQRSGSAAMNLANVACGRIDAFFSTSLKPWDMAAGALLVTEAGGIVSSVSGSQFDVEIPDILAVNNVNIHAELVSAIADPPAK